MGGTKTESVELKFFNQNPIIQLTAAFNQQDSNDSTPTTDDKSYLDVNIILSSSELSVFVSHFSHSAACNVWKLQSVENAK